MVCLGNICRSPLAEGIMQYLAQQEGLNWHIDSAGTGNWHIGQSPDRRSVRVAQKFGIDISKQVCRQFSKHDFTTFDLILVMDKNNYSDVAALTPNAEALEKVKLLLDDKEVPDPYYDDSQFEPVFELIEKGCKKIISNYYTSMS